MLEVERVTPSIPPLTGSHFDRLPTQPSSAGCPLSRFLLTFGFGIALALLAGRSPSRPLFAQSPTPSNSPQERRDEKAIPAAARSMDDLNTEQRQWIEKRTRELIDQLGDDSYAKREKAGLELQRIGMLAFEELRVATLHPDPQIASSAHSLLQRIHQEWGWENDPLEIREILSGYGEASVVDRASMIDRLNKMRSASALAALCRICRYETHDSLSRHAAVRVLQYAATVNANARPEVAKVMQQVIGTSQRSTCQWLVQFAQSLASEELDVAWWTGVLEEERQAIRKSPQSVAPEDVMELNKWLVTRLHQLHRDEEALAEANRMLAIVPSQSTALVEICHWAMEIGLHEWVVSLRDQFSDAFTNYAKLSYALAECYRQSDPDLAERLAQKAFERNAVDAESIPVRLPERQDVASMLRLRGLHDWSVREFHLAWKNADPLNRISMAIYFEYAYLLVDLERYSEAADVWKTFCDRIESEPLYRNQINDTYPEIFEDAVPADAFLANYYFLRGMAAKQISDLPSAKEWWTKAHSVHDDNSDIWIELYQLAESDADRDAVVQASTPMRDRLRQRASQAEAMLIEGKVDRYATHRQSLARALNELAWLQANTGCELDQALESAKRACELSKDSASYLDTLACVHFKRGEYSDAVQHQERVVALEPHRRKFANKLAQYRQKAGLNP